MLSSNDYSGDVFGRKRFVLGTKLFSLVLMILLAAPALLALPAASSTFPSSEVVADAGPDRTITAGDMVLFDGSGSSGPIDDYVWSFEYDGNPVTLQGLNQSFQFDIPGEYEVQLQVRQNGDPFSPYADFGGSHNNIAIGNNRYAPGDGQWAPFNGRIDEMRIHRASKETGLGTDSLIAYWDFNEGSGNILNDRSGYGNHGTLYNSPTWSPGYSGTSLLFTGNKLAYRIPAAMDGPIDQEFTVSTWVNWMGQSTYNPNSYIMDARDIEGTWGGFILYLAPEGQIIFRTQSAQRDMPYVMSSTPLSTNQWNFVEASFDYNRQIMSIHVNGELYASRRGITQSDTDIMMVNVLPKGGVDAGPDQMACEGDVVSFSGSAGGLIPVSFQWDFDASDGIDWDNPDATGQDAFWSYGQDGLYEVTLRVVYGDGSEDFDTCIVTVLNSPPVAAFYGAYQTTHMELRIEGTYGNTVTLEIEQEGQVVAEVSVTRKVGPGGGRTAIIDTPLQPIVDSRDGSILGGISTRVDIDSRQILPGAGRVIDAIRDRTLGIFNRFLRYNSAPLSFELDMSKPFTARLLFESNGIGSNPVWFVVDGRLHYITTFVADPCEPGTWNQEYPVDMAQYMLGAGKVVTFEASAVDPGMDDLQFHWDFGDGQTETILFTNPGVFPFEVDCTVQHTFQEPGEYEVVLTVSDFDGGDDVLFFMVAVPG